jgi:uncharacterized protein
VQPEHLLIVFVKAPRIGAVKTRLAQEIGAEAACAAYHKLVQVLLRNIDSLPRIQLRYSPDEAEPEVRHWCKESWKLSPQGGGDLGERLTRAFADSFASGASRVVIIGSDCPWLSAADIKQAWNDLQTYELILGPAKDGGYWLIGLRAPTPELFANISWSTATVLNQTLDRARVQGLRFRLLRELRDVDTREDWLAFSRDNSFA